MIISLDCKSASGWLPSGSIRTWPWQEMSGIVETRAGHVGQPQKKICHSESKPMPRLSLATTWHACHKGRSSQSLSSSSSLQVWWAKVKSICNGLFISAQWWSFGSSLLWIDFQVQAQTWTCTWHDYKLKFRFKLENQSKNKWGHPLETKLHHLRQELICA